MKWLERYADYAYALLRMATGFMFSFHGAQKILGLFAASQPPVGSQLWFGGLIELFCALAVMLGVNAGAASGDAEWPCLFPVPLEFQLARRFSDAEPGECPPSTASSSLLACRRVKWCLDRKH